MSIKLIQKAIQNSNVDETRLQIIEYANVPTHPLTHDKIHFILRFAVSNHQIDIIKMLVEDYKLDINEINDGTTPLILACKTKSIKLVQFLCENGAQIHLGVNNEYPIHNAAKYSTINILQYLIETFYDKHPDIDYGKDSILNIITDIKMIPYMLQKGASFPTTNSVCNGLMALVSKSATNKKTVQTYLKYMEESGINMNAYMNLIDKYGNTVLHHVVHCHDAKNIVPLLIKHGANVNTINNDGHSPLSKACIYDLDVANILLDNNADAKLFDEHRGTLIHRVMGNRDFTKHYDLISRLISLGVDLNKRAKFGGITVLMMAVTRLDMNLTKMFVDNGADIHAISESGFNVANFLSSNYYSQSQHNNILDILSYLLANNCDFTNCPPDSMTTLSSAIEKGWNIELISMFIDRVDVNQVQNNSNITALMFACLCHKYDIVKLLVKKGAIIDVLDSIGDTAFEYTFKNNTYLKQTHRQQIKILKFLIRKNPTLYTQEVKNKIFTLAIPRLRIKLMDIHVIDAHGQVVSTKSIHA